MQCLFLLQSGQTKVHAVQRPFGVSNYDLATGLKSPEATPSA